MFDPTLLNIGKEKQLFLDDLLLETVENIERTWHQPVKASDAPILVRDRPWEFPLNLSCNMWQVIRDPRDGLFKCWYCDWYKPEIRAGESASGQSIFRILYAESENGTEWRKPEFDVFPHEGRPTNIVVANAYDPGIVLDPHEPDERKRFKMVYTEFFPGGDVEAIAAATSPDGIHWTRTSERPIVGRSGSRLDDVIILHYDALARMFLMNTRHYDMYAIPRNLATPTGAHFMPPSYPLDWARMNKRRIWQCESADLIHWSEPYAVLTPEYGADGLDESFYGLCQYTVGGLTVGILNVLRQVSNTMYTQLVYSRNGKTWEHLNRGRAFLEPGGEGRWDAYMVTIPSAPVEVGDELFVFHDGARNHHDWWMTGQREGLPVPEATDMSQVEYCLGLAKLRLDGFASLGANHVRRGLIVTRPFVSDGSRLVVNAKCAGNGSLAAEVCDVRDQVLPGFGVQDCDIFRGDCVRHTITWRGRSEIPVLATARADYPAPEIDRFRKIRFYLDNTQIYSMQLM